MLFSRLPVPISRIFGLAFSLSLQRLFSALMRFQGQMLFSVACYRIFVVVIFALVVLMKIPLSPYLSLATASNSCRSLLYVGKFDCRYTPHENQDFMAHYFPNCDSGGPKSGSSKWVKRHFRALHCHSRGPRNLERCR